MNGYATVAQIERYLGQSGQGSAGIAVRRDRIADAIDEVSVEVCGRTHRQFHTTMETRYPVWWGSAGCRSAVVGIDESRVLWLPEFVSISSLTVDDDNDGDYELTLAQDTDYRIWPSMDPEPYYELLYLDPNGAQVYRWPCGPRRIKVTGVWGWSNETELCGVLTTSEVLDASETGIDVSDGTLVSPGETIVIDSEQMYVDSITGNTLTVVRAINGTTAATHITASPVSRRRYPRAIERAVRLRLGDHRGVPEFEQLQGERSNYGQFLSLLQPYTRMVVG